MKAWLKGGLIVAGINLVLIILAFIVPSPAFSLDKSILEPNFGIILIVPSILIFEGLKEIVYFKANTFISLVVIPTIVYFLIGALIGWIIGKIKKKP